MTTIDMTTKGRREAEVLRPQRVINYRVKRRVEFTCQHADCDVDFSVLVVRIPGEDVSDGLTTRCQKHLTGEVMPGQWDSR